MNFFNVFEKPDSKEVNEFKKLIEKDNTILKEVDSSGCSYLHIAVIHDNVELAKWIIARDIDVNIQDKKGQTALHFCAERNRIEIASYILAHGGRLDVADKFGNEPLWTAIFNVRRDLSGLDLVQVYLENGANLLHENNVGISPASFANEVGARPILDLIEKFQ
jgi:ankyrin repeat protein